MQESRIVVIKDKDLVNELLHIPLDFNRRKIEFADVEKIADKQEERNQNRVDTIGSR